MQLHSPFLAYRVISIENQSRRVHPTGDLEKLSTHRGLRVLPWPVKGITTYLSLRTLLTVIYHEGYTYEDELHLKPRIWGLHGNTVQSYEVGVHGGPNKKSVPGAQRP